MPTNVTREYLEAQQKYTQARTLEEKIEALKLMLSTVPKHKGTERLRYELKKNLANKRRELQAREQKKASQQHYGFDIPKEGIGQVAIIGPPNSGKSLLLNKLTSSNAKVAPYPFTTVTPSPGMLNYEDVQIQLVEMPALIEEVSEGRWLGPRMFSMLRNADALVILLDLADDPAAQMDMILRELKAARIRLKKRSPSIEVRKTGEGGLQIQGDISDEDRAYVTDLLRSRGYQSATVVLSGSVKREDLSDVLDPSSVQKNVLVVANKGDLPGTERRFRDLVEMYGSDFTVVPVSADKGHGLEALGKSIFELLGVVRIYTKVPGQRPETRPLVLPKGSVVKDVAKSLHKRFITNFRFARVWGASVNFGGEMVGLTHVLADGDVVEIHAR